MLLMWWGMPPVVELLLLVCFHVTRAAAMRAAAMRAAAMLWEFDTPRKCLTPNSAITASCYCTSLLSSWLVRRDFAGNESAQYIVMHIHLVPLEEPCRSAVAALLL